MPRPDVVVVGETPSLGRALVDLLQSDGVKVRYLPGSDAIRLAHGPRHPAVIIVASNAPYSATARRWLEGKLVANSLITVGSRDPVIAPLPNVHRVALPLEPGGFLRLVHSLLPDAPASTVS